MSQSLFVGADELIEAWRIFTPSLRYIDQSKPDPEKYPFGISYPAGFRAFAENRNIRVTESWEEFLATHAEDVSKLKSLFEGIAQCPAEDAECFITKEGLRQLARQYYGGQEAPDARLQKIMDVLDLNGNGRVTWTEFRNGAMHLHQTFTKVNDACADPTLAQSCSNHAHEEVVVQNLADMP